VSLWSCPQHGLVGPSPCCGKSSLATVIINNNGEGALTDHEIRFLYEVCKRHSPYSYGLIRRLHTHGVIKDPESII
jgi:hypothetical protein